MDMDVDDVDEDGTDWYSTDLPLTHTAGNKFTEVSSSVPPLSPQRIILHFDMDCFYAQVEMIRNPALRNVPLGIQQKYIIVTSNYVARDHGVNKLMLVKEALEKCPQLVLVKGEDLTYYRETSYKVTELLMSYCPLVERLGFDENFMDITELVGKRQRQENEPTEYSFKGHVYNYNNVDFNARNHSRLALGSNIAAELREAIYTKLGLTSCAGVATNKLLAKLVSGTFKPNQQTTLLPESVKDIMSRLTGLRKVPGVGHQTARKLQALGLVSVLDLQLFPLAGLVQEFGSSTAQRLHNLALGIDDTPVTPTGAPQSLSDEDSFKKMSSVKEVLQKVEDLLDNLLERMNKDGRQPLTFRLTIRRHSATNKWFNRESRQCPIPNHIGLKIISGSSDALAQLISIALKLFHKMVDTSTAFHLTLINVCFSNLQATGVSNSKGSIASFFTSRSPGKTQTSTQDQEDWSQSKSCSNMDQGGSDLEVDLSKVTTDQDASPGMPVTLPCNLRNQAEEPSTSRHDSVSTRLPLPVTSHTHRTLENERIKPPESRLPPNVDLEVFQLLPEDIQRELLSPAYTDTHNNPPCQTTQFITIYAGDGTQLCPTNPSQLCFSQPSLCKSTKSCNTLRDRKESKLPNTQIQSSNLNVLPDPQAPQGSAEKGKSVDQVSERRYTDFDFPKDIDPRVFSELPPDVQKDLLSEWKQQKLVVKITPNLKKQGNTSLTKEKKHQAKGSQSNNLLKYFKPN